jgi:hypothetical protein
MYLIPGEGGEGDGGREGERQRGGEAESRRGTEYVCEGIEGATERH